MQAKILYLNPEEKLLNEKLKELKDKIENDKIANGQIDVSMTSDLLDSAEDLMEIDEYESLHKTCKEMNTSLSITFSLFSPPYSKEIFTDLTIEFDKQKPYSFSRHANFFQKKFN